MGLGSLVSGPVDEITRRVHESPNQPASRDTEPCLACFHDATRGGTLDTFDPERPETWPLQFFDTERMRSWPDHLLERVSRQLAAIRELTVEAAFVKLLVTNEVERRSETDELAGWRAA
jgi:hypothetical protein